MNFALSEDQEVLRDTFARFATERIKPRAAAIDEAREFPRELFMELAGLGFFGLRYPESLGGVNLDLLSYCLALTEIARGSLSLGAAAAMQSVMGTHFLYVLGNEEIHEQLLTPAIRGEKIQIFGKIILWPKTTRCLRHTMGSLTRTQARVEATTMDDYKVEEASIRLRSSLTTSVACHPMRRRWAGVEVAGDLLEGNRYSGELLYTDRW